jgi:hypothetical protein
MKEFDLSQGEPAQIGALNKHEDAGLDERRSALAVVGYFGSLDYSGRASYLARHPA